MLTNNICASAVYLLTAVLLLIIPSYGLGGEVKVGEAFDITPNLPSLSGQYNPKVAFDGMDTYLVVWEEGADVWQNSKKQVYAARVKVSDSMVRILDPAGIPVFNSNNPQKKPVVAFGGNIFLIVWQELSDSTDYDIKGARINPQGHILDPNSIDIAMGAFNQITPDVSYDRKNKRFFVVWADFRNKANYQLYGARVRPNGSVIDSAGIFLARETFSVVHTPVVGTNGKQFLVAWTKRAKEKYYSYIWAKRFSLNGALLGDAFSDAKIHAGINGALPKFPPLSGVVSNGSAFLVLCPGIYGHGSKYRPLVAFHILSNGTVKNQEYPLRIDRYEKTFSACAVFGREFYFVVWEGLTGKDMLNPNHDLLATRVDQNLENNLHFHSPILIANTPSAELHPAAAKGNSSDILVVYEEDNLLDYPRGKHVIKGRLLSTSLSGNQRLGAKPEG